MRLWPDSPRQDEGRPAWSAWVWCGVAIACGILLRPDGGILLIALGIYLLWRMWRQPAGARRICSGPVLSSWLSRLHRWCPGPFATGATSTSSCRWYRSQPAIPTSSSPMAWTSGCEPGRSITFPPKKSTGRFRATKSTSTLLPSRAFDTPEQRRQTQAILDDYHKILVVNPALNERLMELANDRIRANPLRYYVWLPALRSLDMWLRPRTELLPLNSRWWEYRDDMHDCVLATLWGMLNLLFTCCRNDGSDARAASAISRHDVAVCCAALGLPRNAGEPRTALHAGMLPRGVLAGGCLDFGMEDVTSRCRLVLKGAPSGAPSRVL